MGLWRAPDGRYGIDYHPHRSTSRVRRLVGTRKEAEKVLASLVADAQHARYPILRPPAPDVTFNVLAARFLEDHPGGRRSNHYPKCVARLLRYADFAGKPLGTIARADVDRLRNRLLVAVSPTTTIKTLRTLARMMKLAVRWGIIAVSPAADVEMPSAAPHRIRYLTPEDYSRSEFAAPEWLRPVMRLAVTTGLRLKEIALLQVEDVDWFAALLNVPDDTKTGHRVVPLAAAAEDSLRRVLASGRDIRGDAARKCVSEATRRAMRRAGVLRASFHTLRHTAASWMVQAGVPLLEVQRVLGHSSPAMTARYAHLAPGHLRPAITALDRALLGGQSVDIAGLPDPARGASQPETRGPKGPPPAFSVTRRCVLTTRD